MRRLVLRSLAGLLPVLGWALGAQATTVTYSLSSGGLDGACIRTSGSVCSSASDLFVYAPPAAPPNAYDAATGSITLDDVTDTVTISISVSSATFLDNPSPVGGVDEVEFTSLTYTATFTGVTALNFSDVPFAIPNQNTVTVTGNYEELLAGGNVAGPTAISGLTAVRMSAGSCTADLDGLLCGFFVGAGGTTPFELSIGGANRRIIHHMNVVGVPEPGSLGLLALGLVGLAVARRRSA